MTFVFFWIKDEGQPPVAGGFLRCDTDAEREAFIAQCVERGIAYKIPEDEGEVS